MVVGMDMVGLSCPMEILTKEILNCINATARVDMNGMMDGFTMDSSITADAMARAYIPGLTVMYMMGNL